jgi:hypothetical protein
MQDIPLGPGETMVGLNENPRTPFSKGRLEGISSLIEYAGAWATDQPGNASEPSSAMFDDSALVHQPKNGHNGFTKVRVDHQSPELQSEKCLIRS